MNDRMSSSNHFNHFHQSVSSDTSMSPQEEAIADEMVQSSNGLDIDSSELQVVESQNSDLRVPGLLFSEPQVSESPTLDQGTSAPKNSELQGSNLQASNPQVLESAGSELHFPPLNTPTSNAPEPETSESQSEKLSSQKKVTSLRVQLLRSILPVLLVPLVAASAIGYRVVQQRTEGRIQRQLEDQALLASEGTHAILEELLDIPQTVASNPLVINEVLAGSRQVEQAGLDELSNEVLEQQFQQSKVLRTHQSLNDYLTETAKTAEISKILITERHGLNVAYSATPTDFVQNDETWWQNGASQGLWIGPPDFDFSANSFTIELAQAIKDWNTGELAGVVRVVLPTRKFSLVANYVQRTGLSGSQRVQLIDAAELSVIDTFSPQGFRRDREIIGGKAIEAVATALSQNQQKGIDPLPTLQDLAQQHSLQNVTLKTEDDLVVSFQSQRRQYKVVTIPQTNWVAIASMDIAGISAAGRDLVLLFAGTALLLGGVTTGFILLLSRQLSSPIQELSNTAEQVASGDLNVVAQPHGTRETQTLAQTFNSLLSRVRNLLQQQQAETRKAQLFADITGFSVENMQGLQPVLLHTLEGIRDLLAIDYAAFYRIDADGHASVEAQSTLPKWADTLDPCTQELKISLEQLTKYHANDRVTAQDITETGFTSTYKQQLQEIGLRSGLILPLLVEENVFGLLVVCRQQDKQAWLEADIQTLQQLLSQLRLVIERVFALEQNQQARRTAEVLLEDQRHQKEQLQQRVLALIHDVEGVSQGDLTVRAALTEDEIGKVANFLNLTIANLQTLVIQVKDASAQVHTYLQQNEQAVTQLATEAQQQANQTARSLDSVQQIQHAIQSVSESAYQAAAAAHQASAVAQVGGSNMDRTTQKILDLQQTIMATAQKVERLGNSAKNVSQITNLIKEVALQMTITLNETTKREASLAMAQGNIEGQQPFADVAKKLKHLANRTSEATQPIEQFLSTFQREAGQVVDAMEQVTTQMLEGAHLVQESKQSLGQMLEVSQQVDELVHSISEAIGSQVQTSQTVASLIQDIAQLSEYSSEFSQQLSEALHQTVAVAQELQASVKTFKVA